MINWPVDVTNNKYSKWYNLLIDRALTRELPDAVYFEKHHIIPKSWGGPDVKENIV